MLFRAKQAVVKKWFGSSKRKNLNENRGPKGTQVI